MSKVDILADHAHEKLYELPQQILEMTNLRMLYLEGNFIRNIPEDLFQNLPNLTWLDIRNNQLEDIPVTIAGHPKLETLLLQDNNLVYLPNALGLVPHLVVLQVGGNPLEYPPKAIINEGTKTICNYLKAQHEQMVILETGAETSELRPKTKKDETKSDVKQGCSANISDVEVVEKVQNYASYSSMPALEVRRLSPEAEPDVVHVNRTVDANAKLHRVMRNRPKFTVKSQYSTGNKSIHTTLKVTSKDGGVDEERLKNIWLDKLKELLAEQERLIQQEKNLRTMNQWRLHEKFKINRLPSEEDIIVPPFATDEEFNKMATREELRNEKVTGTKTVVTNQEKPDVDKLMDDVLGQLKQIESKRAETKTPRTQMKASESEIKAILDLHKRIAALQATNHNSL